VLSRSVYSLIAWLMLLLVTVTMEQGTKDFGKHPEISYSFCLLTLPFWSVVMFGCYSLITIGYHMVILCKYCVNLC